MKSGLDFVVQLLHDLGIARQVVDCAAEEGGEGFTSFGGSVLCGCIGNHADLPAVTKRFVELSSSGYVMPFSSLALDKESVKA